MRGKFGAAIVSLGYTASEEHEMPVINNAIVPNPDQEEQHAIVPDGGKELILHYS